MFVDFWPEMSVVCLFSFFLLLRMQQSIYFHKFSYLSYFTSAE